MRYSPKQEEDNRWLHYDKSRMESQNKNIRELQKEIIEFGNREQAFNLHLSLKEKQILSLKNETKKLQKENSEKFLENKSEIILDPLLLTEFKNLKNRIKEKEQLIKVKEDELISLQTSTSNPLFKKIVVKCRELLKENSELNTYTHEGTLESLKYENGLEKSQIDQLMIKLKEKELINQEAEGELNEINEQIFFINKKIKVFIHDLSIN